MKDTNLAALHKEILQQIAAVLTDEGAPLELSGAADQLLDMIDHHIEQKVRLEFDVLTRAFAGRVDALSASWEEQTRAFKQAHTDHILKHHDRDRIADLERHVAVLAAVTPTKRPA